MLLEWWRRLTGRLASAAGALDELERSEARFHAIADHTFGAEAWFDPRGRLIWVNRAIERVTGYTPEECLAARSIISLLVYDKDRRYLRRQGYKAFRRPQGENFELRLRRKDGQVVWVALNWQAIRGKDGGGQGLRISVDEIQARKEVELRLLETVAELRRAQGLSASYLRRSNDERARLAALLNVLHLGVLFVDSDHRVIYCNAAFRRIWGFPLADDLTGVREAVLMERSSPLRLDNPAFLAHLAKVDRSRETSPSFDVTLVDGRCITAMSSLVEGAEKGRYTGRVWIFEDVTQSRDSAEQLQQLATRDALTGLFNRRRFQEELERMLPDAERRGVRVGLLAIDLDAFKPINDSYGHQAGDEVLVALAQELASIIRRNEIIFRLGGDEFAVLVSDTAEEDMAGLARRVQERIESLRFDFGELPTRMTASLGIALYPDDAPSAELLIAHADQAMYQAKNGGKNRWQIYRKPL